MKLVVRLSLLLLLLFRLPTPAYAHGGVIIDSGISGDYEWLIAINPFPLTPGETVLTLLIYNIDTFEPVNGLDVSLLVAPNTPEEECCDPDVHSDAEILIDPELYPGDYSALFNVVDVGDWSAQFTIGPGNATDHEPIRITTIFEAQPLDPSEPRPTIELTPVSSATSVAFAENVSNARQFQSPLESPLQIPGFLQPISPLNTPPVAEDDPVTRNDDAVVTVEVLQNDLQPDDSLELTQFLLFGGLAALPFIALFLWMLRPKNAAETTVENAVENATDDN